MMPLIRLRAQQRQRQRHQDLDRVEVHDHPQHLQDVAVGVLHEVELRAARALRVVDRQVVHRVLVGQERHRDRRDAAEAGGEQAQVGQRDVAPEGPQTGVEVGDLRRGQPLGDLADDPLGRHPEELVGALLGGAGAHDLVDAEVVVEVLDELRDPLVRVRHVGVGPDDDPPVGLARADPPRGAGAAVGAERHEPHVRARRQRGLEDLERVVGRLVVDDEELVGVPAGVHGGGDPVDLLHHVVLLVVAGQDDRHVE